MLVTKDGYSFSSTTASFLILHMQKYQVNFSLDGIWMKTSPLFLIKDHKVSIFLVHKISYSSNERWYYEVVNI